MPGNRHNVGCKVVLLVYGLSWLPRGMERFARKYTTKVPMTLRLRRSLHVDVHPAYKPAVALFLAGFCHVRLREGSGLLVEDAAALVDECSPFRIVPVRRRLLPTARGRACRERAPSI